MTTLSLCSGAGGLELAFPESELVAVAETDEAAAAVLAARFPRVPNLGDITDLSTPWPHADRILAGIPCPAVSEGGRKLGAADPRWLGSHFLRIVGLVRPMEVFLENVEGLTAPRHRAELNEITGGLEGMGYSVRWGLMGACAVDAPMCRHRFYLHASYRVEGWPSIRRVEMPTCRKPLRPLLPAPRAGDGIRGAELRRALRTGTGGTLADAVALGHRDPERYWNPFLDALAVWSKTTGALYPEPSEPAATQSGVRLAARFSEWMMGWPAGWVTDLVARKPALTIAGNGVVPQAAAWAREVLKASH